MPHAVLGCHDGFVGAALSSAASRLAEFGARESAVLAVSLLRIAADAPIDNDKLSSHNAKS